MPRSLNLVTAALFCAFLLLPLGLLAALGPVEPYGNKDFTPFPARTMKLLHSSPNDRTHLSTALFERSPATVFAIRTHNAALYRLIGTIDDENMVSGEREWLFLKQEFWEGKCVPDATIESSLRTIDTMATMAAAAGLPILFTVSPDKITIHPEKLGVRAGLYAGCRKKNGRRWREIAERVAPDLLDHATAILKPENPKVPYFYATDTHWNSRGIALAVNQLVSTIDGTPPSTPVLYAGLPYAKKTDLRNAMLLLGGLEADQEVLAFTSPRQNAKPVMFIIDSFYSHARKQLEFAFPDSVFYDIEDQEEQFGTALQDQSGQVVVNSVERSLFDRFDDWNGALARAILKRNMTHAGTCTYAPPLDLPHSAEFTDVEATGPSSYLAKTDDPNLVVPIPEKADCVRIALEVDKPAEFELYLPLVVGRDDPQQFAEGRTVVVDLPAGKSVLNFMLPTGRVGKELRIDPINAARPFKLYGVAFGTDP